MLYERVIKEKKRKKKTVLLLYYCWVLTLVVFISRKNNYFELCFYNRLFVLASLKPFGSFGK